METTFVLLELDRTRKAHHLLPPATETELCRCEAALGHLLPPSYRALLAAHNGATLYESEMLVGTEPALDPLHGPVGTLSEPFWFEDSRRAPAEFLPFHLGRGRHLFDLRGGASPTGEYPVVEWSDTDGTITRTYADFGDFFEHALFDTFARRF